MILTIILVAKYFYYLNTWVQNNILSRDFIILNLEIKTCSIPHIFLTKSIDLLVIGHFLSSPWLKWTLCPKVHCDKTIIPDKVAGLAVIVFLPRDALCVITNRYHNINREVPQRWNLAGHGWTCDGWTWLACHGWHAMAGPGLDMVEYQSNQSNRA